MVIVARIMDGCDPEKNGSILTEMAEKAAALNDQGKASPYAIYWQDVPAPHPSAKYKAPLKRFYKPPAQKAAPTDTGQVRTPRPETVPGINDDHIGTEEEFSAPPPGVKQAEVIMLNTPAPADVTTGLDDSGVAMTPQSMDLDNESVLDGKAVPPFGPLDEVAESDDDGLIDPYNSCAKATESKIALPSTKAEIEVIDLVSSDDDELASHHVESSKTVIEVRVKEEPVNDEGMRTDVVVDSTVQAPEGGTEATPEVDEENEENESSRASAGMSLSESGKDPVDDGTEACEKPGIDPLESSEDDESDGIEEWGAEDERCSDEDEDAAEFWRTPGRKFLEDSEELSEEEVSEEEPEEDGEEKCAGINEERDLGQLAETAVSPPPQTKVSEHTSEHMFTPNVTSEAASDQPPIVEIVNTRKRKGCDREYQCKRDGQEGSSLTWATEGDLQVVTP